MLIRDPATNVPVNLSGYTARMQVRPTVDSSTILLEATTSNGKIVIVPNAGTITITFSAIETGAYTTANAVYDIETEDLNGYVKRRMEGAITLSKQVTR